MRMASANVLAQILGVLSLPLLSRLFSPEHFATLAVFSVFYGICLSFVTVRIDWLVPNARTTLQADQFVGVGSVVTIAFAIFVLISVLAGRAWFEAQLIVPADSVVPLLLPCGVLAGGIYLLLQARAVYSGDLSRLSISKIAQAISTLALSALLGWILVKDSGLVLGYVVGLAVAALTMHKELRLAIRSVSQLTSLRGVGLLRIYRYQLVSSVSLSLVNVLLQSTPLLLLAFFYDPVVVGWYGLVFRLATAPIGLITTAVSHSFWAEAAALAKRDTAELRRFYLGTVGRLSIIAVPFLFAFLLAPLYVPTLFGQNEWSGAGNLLAAVTPYLVGMIIFSPTTHFIVYRKAHWQLWIDLGTLCLAIPVFGLLAASGQSAWLALLGVSSCSLLGYVVRFFALLYANRLKN
jgi:O-antigen/teichoic acid export membrane protein